MILIPTHICINFIFLYCVYFYLQHTLNCVLFKLLHTLMCDRSDIQLS